ncbi:MAG TPA: aspartate aminotransferase family protein [Bacteroidia bacterium]|nr:aspartate aminotransferase family protein [Bacteroidia bacterium]HNT80948.1 aspartate aminotransferase family protein [Bacteroidia bacterium]
MSTLQVTKSEELLERRNKAVARGVGVFNTATAIKAKGSIITDADGNELIDFAGGIGVVNAGHCPPPVVEAIQKQAAQYLHTSFNVVTYEPYIELCETLAEILPHGEKTKAMLVSTGAEAVENAIKIARQATGKQGILCYTDAFHGRTMMAMTLTSKINYKIGCGPFASEVYRLPFPNIYRDSRGRSIDQFVSDELLRLEESTHKHIDPNHLAAIIIEPVQGEGGFSVVPQKYMEGLRSFCDKYNVMLILDEIQSGFGRTGNWSAWQTYGVTPDISTYAKSMGSGLPIAAVVGKAHVMDAALPGTIGGTYIGSPVCCAAALATIKYFKDELLIEQGISLGSKLYKMFSAMQSRHPEIGDVRGLGAMMAIEFVKNNDPQQPDHDICDELIKRCASRGLILVSAGTYKNVIRVLMPLNTSDEILNKGFEIIEQELIAIKNSN